MKSTHRSFRYGFESKEEEGPRIREKTRRRRRRRGRVRWFGGRNDDVGRWKRIGVDRGAVRVGVRVRRGDGIGRREGEWTKGGRCRLGGGVGEIDDDDGGTEREIVAEGRWED